MTFCYLIDMEFVSIRDLRLNTGQVWKRLGGKGEMVVTSKGRPIALLTEIAAGDVESALRAFRLGRAQLALDQIREETHRTGVDRLSDKQIAQLIKKTRRDRHS